MKSNREGYNSQESARRIKGLLPVGAASAHFSCYTLLSENCTLSPAEYHTESGALAHEKVEQGRNIISREHTLCFQMPLIGQFYIALKMHSFYECICDRMKYVQDCYVLRSRSIYKPFQSFKGTATLYISYDSDKWSKPSSAEKNSLFHDNLSNKVSSCNNLIPDSDDSNINQTDRTYPVLRIYCDIYLAQWWSL